MKTKLISILALLALPTMALAHAFPDHALPRVGATIQQSPKTVKIWFDREIEPAFSTIKVLDSDGKEVDKKDSHVDKDNHKLLIVSVSDLAPGTYKVVWHVVATDTHHTHGDFKFTIKSP